MDRRIATANISDIALEMLDVYYIESNNGLAMSANEEVILEVCQDIL